MTRSRKYPEAGSATDAELLALGASVRESVSRFVRQVRTATGTLRTSQWEALELLEQDGALSIAQLARRRGVRHQTMRLIVATMETEGLVERDDDPGDRRSQRIRITAAARRKLGEARDNRAAWVAQRIGDRLDAAGRQALLEGMRALERVTSEPEGERRDQDVPPESG